ncbi:hypothetical protein EBZ80_19710, partial [bacterium]|nr:hypothetical protein [bacterium]
MNGVITRMYYGNAASLFGFFLYVFFMSFYRYPNQRVIHYLLCQIGLLGGVSYMMMADGLLDVEKPGGRIIHVGRYVEWFLTTPSQLLVLTNLGRLDVPNAYALNLFNFTMILCGLLADWQEGWQRYVYFAIGMFLFFPIYMFLFEDFDEEVVRLFAGEYFSRRYYWMGKYLLLSWILYPVVWMLRSTLVLDELGEAVSYSVLDFFSKIVFQAWVLTGLLRPRTQ